MFKGGLMLKIYTDQWYIRLLHRGVAYAGPQILADQLPLFQPRGADYAHQIILAPPDFQTFLRS